MNKVILSGRLTKDPEVRYLQNGNDSKSVCRFTLAVDRRVARNADGNTVTADFIGCVAWEKKAEFLEKYCKKGTKLVLEGRIQTGSFKDRNGNTVYTEDVVAENLEFAESKNSQGNAPAEQPEDNSWANVPDGIDAELPFN